MSYLPIASMTWSRSRRRLRRGNMIVLCVAIGLMIVALVGIALWFQLIFFSNQLLQNTTEKFALTAAQRLNENDDAGRLNNLIVHSRESVFLARQMHDKTVMHPHFLEFEKLARQVLDDSRQGALLVSDEKQRLVNATILDLRMMAKEKSTPFGKEVALFDATVERPEIVDFSVGTLDNMESNVEAPAGVPELKAYDSDQNFLKHGKSLDFYVAGRSLKLPHADADLDFVLSPLPMVVNGTAAPMRLVAESHYKPTLVLVENGKDAIGSCSIMPSCAQVSMSVRMKSKVADKVESGTKSLSTACTNGAMPEPK